MKNEPKRSGYVVQFVPIFCLIFIKIYIIVRNSNIIMMMWNFIFWFHKLCKNSWSMGILSLFLRNGFAAVGSEWQVENGHSEIELEHKSLKWNLTCRSLSDVISFWRLWSCSFKAKFWKEIDNCLKLCTNDGVSNIFTNFYIYTSPKLFVPRKRVLLGRTVTLDLFLKSGFSTTTNWNSIWK